MKIKLPSLTVGFVVLAALVWWQQYGRRPANTTAAESPRKYTASDPDRPPLEPAQAAANPRLNGQLLIKAAGPRRVSRHPSIASKLRLTVDMFGQRLVGTGNYLQLGQGEDKLLRLELSIQTDEHTMVFQQVADGRFLWMRRDLGNSVNLSRVDLKRLRRELAGRAAQNAPVDSSAWMALGGLAKLLVNLEENFTFSAPQAGRVAEKEMLIVEGRWKPDRLAELLPDPSAPTHSRPKSVGLSELPPQLPHRVVVLLGRDDLFPYRVEYLQQEQGEPARAGAEPSGRRAKVINRLEFYEVKVPATIDPLRFVYKPDATQIEDRTQAVIESLTSSRAREEK